MKTNIEQDLELLSKEMNDLTTSEDVLIINCKYTDYQYKGMTFDKIRLVNFVNRDIRPVENGLVGNIPPKSILVVPKHTKEFIRPFEVCQVTLDEDENIVYRMYINYETGFGKIQEYFMAISSSIFQMLQARKDDQKSIERTALTYKHNA